LYYGPPPREFPLPTTAGDRQIGRCPAIETKGFRPSELIDEKPASRFERVRVDASVTHLHILVAIPYIDRGIGGEAICTSIPAQISSIKRED
jgi:hypothetical protein